MKEAIIRKTFYQTMIAAVLAILYMQIRPVKAYTFSWPCAAIAAVFVLFAWFAYLRYDKMSLLKVEKKPEKPASKFRVKTIIDYVNSPIYGDGRFSDEAKQKIKIISDGISAVIFFIAAWLF